MMNDCTSCFYGFDHQTTVHCYSERLLYPIIKTRSNKWLLRKYAQVREDRKKKLPKFPELNLHLHKPSNHFRPKRRTKPFKVEQWGEKWKPTFPAPPARISHLGCLCHLHSAGYIRRRRPKRKPPNIFNLEKMGTKQTPEGN